MRSPAHYVWMAVAVPILMALFAVVFGSLGICSMVPPPTGLAQFFAFMVPFACSVLQSPQLMAGIGLAVVALAVLASGGR